MPPVEFDTIPRIASNSTNDGKHSVAASNFLELGSVEPIITRSKGSAPQLSDVIKDVEIPEVDSDDETTIDKIMKDYSEEESADDSDYLPSDDSEDEHDATTNVITRSKGIPPNDSGIVKDVDIPEVDSEDEMTVDKIMKDYSDQEEASGDDADYVPCEGSEDELEYDSDASISDDEEDGQEVIEDVGIPKSSFTRSSKRIVIEDVNIPKVSNAVIKDIPIGHSELSSIANDVVKHLSSFTIVQTGIKAVDVGLNICEKLLSARYKQHVQGVRRHLRAIRRSGKGSERGGFFDFFIEMFMVNWFLSFIGLTINVESGSNSENGAMRKSSSDEEFCDDEESTVYKLMKDYDSQDDEDYVPGDCTEDSMEFQSDCSDDETIIEKIMKDYSEDEDSDYIPSEEESDDEEGIEYDSDAEVSDDSDYDSSDVEDSSEDETVIAKIMKDYSEEESDFDADYVPDEEEAEDDIEFDSDASITDTDNGSESELNEDMEEHGSDEDDESQGDEDESQADDEEYEIVA